MDAELLGRINALEAMVTACAAAMIFTANEEKPDRSEVEDFVRVVRGSVDSGARRGESHEQSLKAFDDLCARLRASLALLYAPDTLDA